jgi:hypothetical protein
MHFGVMQSREVAQSRRHNNAGCAGDTILDAPPVNGNRTGLAMNDEKRVTTTAWRVVQFTLQF